MEKIDPFINGVRLYLREVRQSDVNENYYRWMNDKDVNQYLESRFYPNSMDTITEFVKSKQADFNNVFLAIILKKNNEHIGNIKLGPINWIHKRGDVGIMIGEKNHWGKGYATEAIKLLAEYAFVTLGLHKLVAGCYDLHLGSAEAFKKSGFEIEGVLKSHSFCEGRYVDVIKLGLVCTVSEK